MSSSADPVGSHRSVIERAVGKNSRWAQAGLALYYAVGLGIYASLFVHQALAPQVLHRYTVSYAIILLVATVAMAAVTLVTQVLIRVLRPGARNLPFHKHSTTLLREHPVRVWLLILIPWALIVAATFQYKTPWELRLFAIYLFAGWAALTMLRCSTFYSFVSRAGLALTALGAAVLALGAWSWVSAGAALVDGVLVVAGLSLLIVTGTTSRSRQINILVACFSLIVSVAAVELALRVTSADAPVTEVELSGEFHHNYRPNVPFVRYPGILDEFQPVYNEINSIGIRGPEIVVQPVRILLIGDSMIQAEQIPWEKSLGSLLQQELNSKGLAGTVVSHGIASWSPLLEWNWYLKVGKQFSPEIVLLFVFRNDFVPSSVYDYSDEAYLERVVLNAEGHPDYFIPPSRQNRWFDHLNITRQVRSSQQAVQDIGIRGALGGWRNRVKTGHSIMDMEAAREQVRRETHDSRLLTTTEVEQLFLTNGLELEQQLEAMKVRNTPFWQMQRPLHLWSASQLNTVAKSEEIIRQFAIDVAGDGGRLVLVYIPEPTQVGGEECALGRYFYHIAEGTILPARSGLQEWLAQVSVRHDIELLDPTDAMRQYPASNSWDDHRLYLRADCHLSEFGHQFMGQFLAEWYLKR